MLRDYLLTSLTFLLLKKGNQAVGALALEGKQGNIFTFKKRWASRRNTGTLEHWHWKVSKVTFLLLKKGKQAVGALTLEHSLHTNIDMVLDTEIGDALLVGHQNR